MNRKDMTDDILNAYMNSIYEGGADAWISNVITLGHDSKPLSKMTDDELSKAHREWCAWAYEE